MAIDDPFNPDDQPQLDAKSLMFRLGQVEQQMSSMQNELEHSHRLSTLGTIAGVIAHEFNNILTPILSYSQLAMKHPDDEELRTKAIERAAAGAEKAAGISQAILSFVEETRSDPDQCASVAEAVDEAFLCLARDPAQDGIELTVEVEDGCVVAMEPVALQQVLLNLILNARRAMEDGGGKLTIRAGVDGGGGCSTWNTSKPPPGAPEGRARAIRIEIEDTGCGIPPEMRERIFAPFVSLDGPRAPATLGVTRQQRGTGLGLAICKRLVDGVGGTIDVESQVSVGTCFTMILVAAEVGEVRKAG